MSTMRELWDEARMYGKVRLFTMEKGTYHVCIEFSTIAHVTLEAKSSFDEITPEGALKSAIEKAKSVVGSMSELHQKTLTKETKL